MTERARLLHPPRARTARSAAAQGVPRPAPLRARAFALCCLAAAAAASPATGGAPLAEVAPGGLLVHLPGSPDPNSDVLFNMQARPRAARPGCRAWTWRTASCSEMAIRPLLQ
jgi:hypothetical protein